MLKRLGTLLLATGLIGLGLLFFLAPERGFVFGLLARYWPVFLILAGLVRVAGYLIDRHPKSPVGGMIITALGGIILAANLTGRHSFLQIAGQYWFWLLLALIAGRVLRQYTHRFEDGQRAGAFSPGAVVLMILIAGGGLAANVLSTRPQYLGRFNTQAGKLGDLRDYLFGSQITIEDEEPLAIDISRARKLVLSNPSGDIRIEAAPQAAARIVKKIRSSSEADAKAAAARIHLSSGADGDSLSITSRADSLDQSYSTTIVVGLPADASPQVRIDETAGSVGISGVGGEFTARNARKVEASDIRGPIRIENPQGPVELKNITGEVQIINLVRNATLELVSGAIRIEASGCTVKVDKASGPVDARISQGRIELTDIGMNLPQATRAERTVNLHDISNSRLALQGIKGAAFIEARNTGVDVSAVTGAVTINSTVGDIRAGDIIGSISVTTDNGEVSIENVKGDVVASSERDIDLRNIKGRIEATSRIGAIQLDLAETPAGEIRAVSERGRIRATLPPDAAFRLDATTEFGRARITGFDSFSASGKERTRITGFNLSDSAPPITLQSTRGDLTVQASSSASRARQ